MSANAWMMVSGCVVLVACGKPEAQPAPAGTPTPTAAVHLKGYEAVRRALAQDDLSGAQSAAREMAAPAAKGSAEVVPELQPGHAKLGQAAGAIGGATSIEAARVAFGDLSREVIGMLAARPEMAQGVRAYECPMASGYRKWVQLDAEMANPYMGKKMLRCGAETRLVP